MRSYRYRGIDWVCENDLEGGVVSLDKVVQVVSLSDFAMTLQ